MLQLWKPLVTGPACRACAITALEAALRRGQETSCELLLQHLHPALTAGEREQVCWKGLQTVELGSVDGCSLALQLASSLPASVKCNMLQAQLLHTLGQHQCASIASYEPRRAAL
uniref:Uncharacterized protein n=1 Tax=Chlamydomonas leiostraca TaxID=1034604 RepID=A0A7S0RV92_9CHLO|mmetsp:Transcript_3222/g.8018  ORF Transcript_3222/g.8018 Transcript_3222/m.8018 type:complete len:115 (+) Transcript_3222:201-545(+)